MIYRTCFTCLHQDKKLNMHPCYKCETQKNYECSEWEPKSLERYEQYKEKENER